jgi:dTDP-4-amino-4,6-dideoxygalactose transaminase
MILMNDFKAEPVELRESMVAAAQRVLESGWYVLGGEVSAFERQWASACGASHGVGVGNGMDAIEIILRAKDIGPGDEVITTPMTAFATVLGVLRAGATPVLADIDSGTGLMSSESVQRCLSERTRAVLLVHLYGQVRDMDTWLQLCKDEQIHLIEDCAQAHLATWGGAVAGSFGAAGAYSFYPTKNLGAPGDAGMLVTNDEAMAHRAQQLRNYGQSVRYHHPIAGLNSRLDEIHAAILAERLKWLPGFTKRRQQIAANYQSGITNPLVRLAEAPQEELAHVHHLYVLNCVERDRLIEHLEDCGVQSLIHYPIPVHRQEPCVDLRRDPAGLSASESHAATVLSIPCHPHMTDSQVEQVIDAVNSFRAG